MDFVDRHGRLDRVKSSSSGEPILVVPLVARYIPNLRRSLRTNLGGKGIRVRLGDVIARAIRFDGVLVECTLLDTRNKQIPDAVLSAPLHRVGERLPVVEVAD